MHAKVNQIFSEDETVLCLHWLPVQHRIDYKVSVLTYKYLNTSVPRYLSQRVNRRVNARTLHTTATPLLIQPFARTDFAKRSFRCAAPSVWNSLPASVIESDSLSVFKSRLKHSYFVGPLTSTHNRLPPAPPKLRPYGTLQICLCLLLLLLCIWSSGFDQKKNPGYGL